MDKPTKSIVLLGKLGHGKTLIINKTCGESFKSESSPQSCTRWNQSGQTTYFGINVIDTPGFYAAEDIASHVQNQRKALEDLPLCGVYLVVKFGRNAEMLDTLNKLMDFVGDDDVRILVTHGDIAACQEGFNGEDTRDALSTQLDVAKSNIGVFGKQSTAMEIEYFLHDRLHNPRSFKADPDHVEYIATQNAGARIFNHRITSLESLIDASRSACEMLRSYIDVYPAGTRIAIAATTFFLIKHVTEASDKIFEEGRHLSLEERTILNQNIVSLAEKSRQLDDEKLDRLSILRATWSSDLASEDPLVEFLENEQGWQILYSVRSVRVPSDEVTSALDEEIRVTRNKERGRPRKRKASSSMHHRQNKRSDVKHERGRPPDGCTKDRFQRCDNSLRGGKTVRGNESVLSGSVAKDRMSINNVQSPKDHGGTKANHYEQDVQIPKNNLQSQHALSTAEKLVSPVAISKITNSNNTPVNGDDCTSNCSQMQDVEKNSRSKIETLDKTGVERESVASERSARREHMLTSSCSKSDHGVDRSPVPFFLPSSLCYLSTWPHTTRQGMLGSNRSEHAIEQEKTKMHGAHRSQKDRTDETSQRPSSDVAIPSPHNYHFHSEHGNTKEPTACRNTKVTRSTAVSRTIEDLSDRLAALNTGDDETGERCHLPPNSQTFSTDSVLPQSSFSPNQARGRYGQQRERAPSGCLDILPWLSFGHKQDAIESHDDDEVASDSGCYCV